MQIAIGLQICFCDVLPTNTVAENDNCRKEYCDDNACCKNTNCYIPRPVKSGYNYYDCILLIHCQLTQMQCCVPKECCSH